MTRIVISVENLSKRYRLGVIGTGSFDGDIKRWWAQKRGIPDPILKIGEADPRNRTGEIIWALKDINFFVHEGEAVGIIGHNGAGKSTLFKVLSQVTAPTKGEVRIKGNIASLLEVGTGFHPDLTGRENIFMNGAIMGMRRDEIRRKLDEIVDFSGVEKYIDTPVKRYSSGMYVRLAFAVAAHLDPDILVVDEVLAVGDAAFQRKCLNKMGDVGKEGRTVLFISHVMSSIIRLCQRAILLDGGSILHDGPSPSVVSAYLQANLNTSAKREWVDTEKAPGDDVVRLRSVRVRTEDGKVSDEIDSRFPILLETEYEVIQSGFQLLPAYRLTNQDGTVILTTMDAHPKWRSESRSKGCYTSTVKIPGNFLANGNISVLISIKSLTPPIEHVYEKDVVAFQVVDNRLGAPANAGLEVENPGVVRPHLSWNTKGPE
jgi:homopolymeric O-antigen transport system ATP-binding protein